MSSLGTPWRPSNPAGGGAATTTDETTHRRRAHADVQRRTSDSACQPDVRRIGIRTRVFSHSKTSAVALRSEEHTSELQSPCNLVCRLLLEKKKNKQQFKISQ